MPTKLLIVVLCSMIATVAANAKTEKPNIVFLLADDMGYSDLGCFGSPVIKSPNLDKLAANGIKLTNCYAASPNCSPARTAILTGRSPYRVGMYDYARFKPMHIPIKMKHQSLSFRDRFDILLVKRLSSVAGLRYTILYGKSQNKEV